MKIGFVSPYDWAYPGGVNNHIENLSNEFQRLGHQTIIVWWPRRWNSLERFSIWLLTPPG